MFSFILFSLAIISSVSALTLPRHHLPLPRRHLIVPRAQPQGWATGYLEGYDQYHTRYMALGCEGKHNTTFFNDCCHPLLATEKLETARPSKCIPSSSTTTTIVPNPTDGECVDPSSSTTSTKQPETPKDTPTPTPTPTPPPVKDTPKPQPDPTTTSTTHSSSKPAPSVPATGGGGSQTGGHATFFYQNNVAGACGTVHGDYDLVAAMDFRRYGPLDVKSILCGRQVKLTNTNNAKSVTVTIADACPTCDNRNSIDLSVGAFQRIADLSTGLVPIAWDFV